MAHAPGVIALRKKPRLSRRAELAFAALVVAPILMFNIGTRWGGRPGAALVSAALTVVVVLGAAALAWRAGWRLVPSGMPDPRLALWQTARLAAIGTATATMNHDLRGAMSSAMLVADRLTMSPDPAVQQAGEVVVGAVQRATGIAAQLLKLVREGPPTLTRERIELRALIDAAAAAAGSGRGCAVRNGVTSDVTVEANGGAMLHVFTTLIARAAASGARNIAVMPSGEGPEMAIAVFDDAGEVAEAATDLIDVELATARDFMRAQGGDLRLSGSRPHGAGFMVYMRAPASEGD